jgi:hypothetical protein
VINVYYLTDKRKYVYFDKLNNYKEYLNFIELLESIDSDFNLFISETKESNNKYMGIFISNKEV